MMSTFLFLPTANLQTAMSGYRDDDDEPEEEEEDDESNDVEEVHECLGWQHTQTKTHSVDQVAQQGFHPVCDRLHKGHARAVDPGREQPAGLVAAGREPCAAEQDYRRRGRPRWRAVLWLGRLNRRKVGKKNSLYLFCVICCARPRARTSTTTTTFTSSRSSTCPMRLVWPSSRACLVRLLACYLRAHRLCGRPRQV